MKIRNKHDGAIIDAPALSWENHRFVLRIKYQDSYGVQTFEERDGWKQVTDTNVADKWRKIERDKDGFATDECFDEMFSSIPIAIRSKDNDYYAIGETDDLGGWRGDIEIHPFYTHWMKLAKFGEE